MDNNIDNKEIKNVSNNIDLAEDTFLQKWPTWLRWILFLPSTIFFSFIGMAIYRLLVIISPDYYNYSDSAWFEIMSAIILGALFIFIAVLVAPKHQFIISIILLVLVTIFATFLVLFPLLGGYNKEMFLTFICNIAMIIGAGSVVVWVKKETR